MPDHTKPNEATRQADRDALDAPHGATEELTADQAEAAEKNTVDEDVKTSYREATELGAKQKGEGRIP